MSDFYTHFKTHILNGIHKIHQVAVCLHPSELAMMAKRCPPFKNM